MHKEVGQRFGIRRFVFWAVTAALLAGCVSCSALSLPFGDHARQESLRKQVEADPFPSAKQAGL